MVRRTPQHIDYNLPVNPIFWKKLLPGRLATFGLILLLITACAPGATEPPLSLPTVELTESTPTPTIDWFPATSTPTLLPSPLPSATPEILLGLGPQTFSDNFSDLKPWSNARAESDGGNRVLVTQNRLTLAVNIPPAALSSIRTDLNLTDFYVEVTASINRCQGDDAYGLLYRAAGQYDAYRFVLNCKGEIRVEQMRSGNVFPLQDWVPSGDAPPGAPGEVKLGVWVAGVEMRFFLNGHYQFTVFDPVLHTGSVGFFAESASPAGLNIGFSGLTVYDVSYASPTPTSTPTRTPTPTKTRSP